MKTETLTWHRVVDELPPENEIVKTKIEDKDGRRNEANLFKHGNLWFIEDGSMYVYYTPTHWDYIY